MSTALVPIDTLGAEIKARIAAGDKSMDKAEQHYIAAGIQLAEAKARLERTQEMKWSAFLFSHARINRRRADDLIAIGDGRVSLAEHREKNRERVAAHRERKKQEPALRNAEPDLLITALPQSKSDEVGRLKAEMESLRNKLIKANDLIKERESQRAAQESLAAIAEKQSKEAHTRAMFAEADRDQVKEQITDIRKRLTDAYYGQVDVFRRHINGPHIDQYVEASIEEFMGEARIDFEDVVGMVEMAGYCRIGEFFELHCNKSERDPDEHEWVRHRKQVDEKIADNGSSASSSSTVNPIDDGDPRVLIQKQLDDARNELAIAQRKGEFQRAGELAYGAIPDLEKQIAQFGDAEPAFKTEVFLTKGALAS